MILWPTPRTFTRSAPCSCSASWAGPFQRASKLSAKKWMKRRGKRLSFHKLKWLSCWSNGDEVTWSYANQLNGWIAALGGFCWSKFPIYLWSSFLLRSSSFTQQLEIIKSRKTSRGFWCRFQSKFSACFNCLPFRTWRTSSPKRFDWQCSNKSNLALISNCRDRIWLKLCVTCKCASLN